jgi:hypothetical protein
MAAPCFDANRLRFVAERVESFFGACEVEVRAQLKEDFDGGLERLARALRLACVRVGASEFKVRARGVITVVEDFKDRDAAPEVVRGQSGIPLPHREQTADALRLAHGKAQPRQKERRCAERLCLSAQHGGIAAYVVTHAKRTTVRWLAPTATLRSRRV